MKSYILTIFKNIKETETPFYVEVAVVLERIKKGASKELVLKIRTEKDKAQRNELKKQLPSICFSGKFTKRSDVSIENHSGLICLDLDGYNKQKDLLADKVKFGKDKYVYSVFISPSGKGLKVLVKIPKIIENHIGSFVALQKYFDSPYFDKTCKNISRVCYESYDPLIFINDNSHTWNTVEDLQYKEVNIQKDAKTIPITDPTKIIDILTRWWTKNYPMSEGQRNHNAFILAMAFNDFGVSKTTASLIINQYKSKNFNSREIETTIKSAYANTQNFNTKYYEDEDKINDIQQRLRRGESKKIIKQELINAGIEEETAASAVDKAQEDNSIKFWTKSEKGVVKIVPLIFKNFLENKGFHKFCPEGQKNYMFVKSTSNLIDHSSEKEIKDFILNYLFGLEDMSIYNHFADSTRYFKEDYLTLLGTVDVYFVEDTIDKSYLYFENCALLITKDEVIPIDYLNLNGKVWRSQVINHKFEIGEQNKGDYKQFVANICNKNTDRIQTMESTIGYMMHGHKNVSYCPAVILHDEVISDTANGGTGKGIWIQALGLVNKLVVIDGKAFNFDNSFPLQLVTPDTKNIAFDDVKKYFTFERMFSLITEGVTLEKKNKDAIKIPFKNSPKIIISSNYAIKGSGSSFARRKWEVELSQHYNLTHTPSDDFDNFLFGDNWDAQQWSYFYNYMISCNQLYLRKGLIKGEFVNLGVRTLETDTSYDFIEWCGLDDVAEHNPHLMVNTKIYMKTLYDHFVLEFPDNAPKAKRHVPMRQFYRWLKLYCIFIEGIEPEVKRGTEGKWMRIRPRHEGQVQQDLIF